MAAASTGGDARTDGNQDGENEQGLDSSHATGALTWRPGRS
jgi:hypothetical protein